MAELPRDIEIQRVMNLVQGFGWTKVKEEVVGTKISITIEKETLTEAEIIGPGAPS